MIKFEGLYLEYNVIDSRQQDGYTYLRIKKENGRTEWLPRYKLVYELYVGPLVEGMHIHHIDFNKWNDRPRNLKQMTREEHAAIHGKYYDIKGVGASRMLGKKHTEETKNKMSESAMGNNNSDRSIRSVTRPDWVAKISKSASGINGCRTKKDITIETVIDLYSRNLSLRKIAKLLGCSGQVVANRLKWHKEDQKCLSSRPE